MSMAAETVAWFALGGERDDYRCGFSTPRMCFLWIGWEAATATLSGKTPRDEL